METPVRILLAGAGFIGREHLKSGQGLPKAAYVGVVDKAVDVASSTASEYGIPVFDDLEKAIVELRPDAVDVCVPTPYHLRIVETCARRKIHVLCEKPMALSVDEARKIRDVAVSAGIRIMVAQVIRFWPEYVYAHSVVKERKYGEVRAIECKRLSSPPGWNSWMLDPDTGGGAVIDFQIHDMDFVLQLLGIPIAINATGRLYAGAYNSVFNRLIYPSGIPVMIESSFLMPPSYPFRMYFRIDFEQASLEMDFWRPVHQRLKVFPLSGDAFCPDISVGNAYRREIEYFATQLIKTRRLLSFP